MNRRILATAVLLAALGFGAIAEAADLFKARLTGEEEVPPVETDTKGRLTMLANRDQGAAEYMLRIDRGMRLTQAHLHCGAAGINGPVIVFLAGFHEPGWDVDGKWISNATITDENVVDVACGATLAEILAAARDGNVYVNVHSVDEPAGVVRGQLEPARGR
jgi:hypothetical protein